MNPRSNKINIALDGRLDLTRNNIDVSEFDGFREKNSPVYGNALSPLYTKTEESDVYTVFNTNGDKFYMKDGSLYKNDIEVMKTKGDGYFTVKENNERNKYDTYDIDDDGNTAFSKYERGEIKYTHDGNEYTFAASSAANATIDCRTRIVNGNPITAYIFATPSGEYQFVYLSKDIQQAYIGTTKNSRLSSSQTLSETTAGSGTFAQNRNTNITTQYVELNDGGKGFLNPLIQISNPLDDVYVISFITNNGGKIDPETDIGYFNIINNKGTFYNQIRWNTTSTQMELEHEQTVSIVSEISFEDDNTVGTCYAYEIPSGNATYDEKHKKEKGKYFLEIDRYGNLVNEIVFDADYEPKWRSTTNDFDGTTQYIKYQQFEYTLINYKLNIKNTATGMEATDTADLKYPFIEKVKHNTVKEFTVFNDKEYLTAIKNDEDYTYYLYDSVTHEPIYKKILIANTGTDVKKYQPNTRDGYRYKPLWNIDYDLTNPRVPLVQWDDSGYCTRIDNGAYQMKEFWTAYSPRKYVRRNIHYQNPAWREGLTTVPKYLNYARYDDAPVVYTSTQAYHELQVGETYMGKVITDIEDTYELNEFGDKLQADITYWNTIYDTNIYEPMSADKTPETETLVIPMFTSVRKDEGKYPEIRAQCLDTLYRTFYDVERYTYFTEKENEFTGTITGNGTLQWTFTYPGISSEFDKDFMWEGFDSDLTATITLFGQAPQDEFIGHLKYNGAPIQFTKTYIWTSTQSVTTIMTPTVFLDDGTAVSTGYINKRSVLPVNNILCFQARPTSIDENMFYYNAIGFYNTGGVDVYGCVLRTSIDINCNYFRTVISLSNGTNSTSVTAKGMQILYDSGDGDTYCNAGGLSADVTSGSGWFTALFYNNQGSISKAYDKWRYLINSSGLISGLSYGNENFIGTLLTEWNSIDESEYPYFTDTTFTYKNTDGKWYDIVLVKEQNEKINIIFDRYIIVHTNGFWNCYDIERGQPLHYATDFNNRAMAGVSMKRNTNYLNIGINNSSGHSLAKFFVSGINSMYEVSQVAITSIQISPQAYLNITTGYESFIWSKADDEYQPQYIEIFAGINTDATSATYQYSTCKYDITSITLKDSSLVGLNSPVAVGAMTYYSPNIFTEFIHTYNNKDLIKNGKYGYPIVYNETTPILSYSSGKQISNVDGVFVIQSQFYAMIGGKIISITYDDYSIIGIDAIIDISGMIYLGNLPTRAYFWSPANRAIYSFTGDANLSLEMEANSITEVYDTYYSTMKEALFITTDKGTYVISDIQQYHIDTGKVEKIFFVKDGYFICEERETNTLRYYSYEKDLLKNSVKVPVKVDTKFYGPGSGRVTTTDKIAVMIRADDIEKGKVLLSTSTLTDMDMKSENKRFDITADKFNNGFMVINYTPKYSQGQGIALHLTSDFPVVRMTFSTTELVQNTLTKHNI